MVTVPTVILAAGASSRCPEGKLLKLYKGRPLLEWVLLRLGERSKTEPLFVVTGRDAQEIDNLVSGRASCVHNSDWKSGLASSLLCGLDALPASADGVLVCLGDTPLFSASTLESVLPSLDELEEIRMPVYKGQAGHPKYFPSWLFPEMRELRGDEGARSLVKKYSDRCVKLPVDDPGILRDFDRAEDFE